jgi:carbon starvation protein CstA
VGHLYGKWLCLEQKRRGNIMSVVLMFIGYSIVMGIVWRFLEIKKYDNPSAAAFWPIYLVLALALLPVWLGYQLIDYVSGEKKDGQ